MVARDWDNDEALLADLADAVSTSAGFDRTVAELGRGAYAWRTVDDDLLLAVLSFDSSTQAVSHVRSSGADPRTVIFTSAPLAIELEVTGARLVGQLLPASTGTIVVESKDGARRQVDADDLGFFVVDPVPAGLVRIRCDTAVARLVTDWVQL